jgi:crossover junction endodeoxyribonuclease RusA
MTRMTEAEYAAATRRLSLTEHEKNIRARQMLDAMPMGPLRTVGLILPFPPSLNHSGKDSFRGGRKSEEYKAFMLRVAWLVKTAGHPHIDGRLAVEVELAPPFGKGRRFDLDNRLKALLDALQRTGVFSNDEQIDDLRIMRVPSIQNGEAKVTIRRLEV